jgi:hypothetical protein
MATTGTGSEQMARVLGHYLSPDPEQRMLAVALGRIAYIGNRVPDTQSYVALYALCRLPLRYWIVAYGQERRGWWDVPFFYTAHKARRDLRAWVLPLIRDGVVDIGGEVGLGTKT